MKAKIGLAVSALLIAWLVTALVRVENQRYALQLGMCFNESTKMQDLACIARTETRTAWFWHLYYALKG